jgi:hypothetical protein
LIGSPNTAGLAASAISGREVMPKDPKKPFLPHEKIGLDAASIKQTIANHLT